MTKTYLALGDSMSIDQYTGVEGGGAVAQLFKRLGSGWSLVDRSADGCRIAGVPTGLTGDLITLTIGGNDLIADRDFLIAMGLESFRDGHRRLLERIRKRNPAARFLVGDIYRPDIALGREELGALTGINEIIRDNALAVGAVPIGINAAFEGRQSELLTLEVEPSLAGATVIAELFHRAADDLAGSV